MCARTQTGTFRVDLDRAAGTYEGLLVNVAVPQDSPVEQSAIGVHDLPPVSVPIATPIGALDADLEGQRARRVN